MTTEEKRMTEQEKSCACCAEEPTEEGERDRGPVVAEAVRHPRHVLACSSCGALSEHAEPRAMSRAAQRANLGRVTFMGGFSTFWCVLGSFEYGSGLFEYGSGLF